MIKIRLDRGNGLIVWGRNVLLIVAAIKYILTLNMPLTLIVGLAVLLLIYLLGVIDLDYLKLAQAEAEIMTREYNPYFTKLENQINAAKKTPRKI